MPNDENSNSGDFTSDLSVATLNVNSLYKAENIEHVVFNKKIKKNYKNNHPKTRNNNPTDH